MAGLQYIDCDIKNGNLIFTAKGDWLSGLASAIETEIDLCFSKAINLSNKNPNALTAITIETSAITKLDTYGSWLIERLKRNCTAKFFSLSEGLTEAVQITGLTSENQKLFKIVKNSNKGKTTPTSSLSLKNLFKGFQKQTKEFSQDLLSFANMLGAVTFALYNVLKKPSSFRFTSSIHQLDKVAWQAIPIITLITLLIGGIIAQQGFFHFSKLGAELYVVDMVGILVLREVGILLVAIMVAGRTGSAFTAELGSMKMREEIDALQTMGFNPVEVLILPRIMVLICAVPILTFIGSMAALYGGGLAAWLYGGMSPEIFVQRLKEAISLTHFKVGMIKAPFMGLVIGLVACAEGLKVKGSAESLGQQTTKSVVKAIFIVIVLDGLFAIFFASIGM